MPDPGSTPTPMVGDNPQVIATALRDLIARATAIGMIRMADELTEALNRIGLKAKPGEYP